MDITYEESRKKYMARSTKEGKRTLVGRYPTKDEAQIAIRKFNLEHNPDEAKQFEMGVNTGNSAVGSTLCPSKASIGSSVKRGADRSR